MYGIAYYYEMCSVMQINNIAASGRGMKDPAHKDKKGSPQAVGNITHMIPRLRSGSVRLNNFDSQNYSLTDLKHQPGKSIQDDILVCGLKVIV